MATYQLMDIETEFSTREELNPFTTKRQCFVILTLLTYFGLDLSKLNNADIARIIHLFAGKGIPGTKIDNSYIYKTLKKLRKDAEIITPKDYLFIEKTLLAVDNPGTATHLKRFVKLLNTKQK